MVKKIVFKVVTAVYVFVIVMGLFNIYVASRNIDKLNFIEGTVYNKKVASYTTGKGGRYYEAYFAIEGKEKSIAMPLEEHTWANAVKDTAFTGVVAGGYYRFYLNPVFPILPADNRIALKITDGAGHQVYRYNARAALISGMTICLLGVGGMVLMWLLKKRQARLAAVKAATA